MLGDREPVHAGKPDVEHREHRLLLAEQLQRLFAGARCNHLIAVLLEDHSEIRAQPGIVLDDEDGARQGV